MNLWHKLRSYVVDPVASELRQTQRELRHNETQLQLAESRRQLKRVKFREASVYDWVTPYTDLLNRYRMQSWEFLGPLNQRRRHGANFPIYQTEQELALLRAPSRILCSTNNYAIGFVEGLTSFVFGANGFQYSCQFRDDRDAEKYPGLTDAVQKIIDGVLKRNSWYGDEQPNFEEECFQRSLEDGEFIIVSTRQEDGMTDFRLIEPEYMTQKPGEQVDVYSFGVKVDPDDAATPLAYWIQHGDTANDGYEYNVDEVLHFRRRAKRNQKRGLPEFSFAGLEALEQASGLLVNLGDAAQQQAAIVGVRQHDNTTKAEIEAFVDNLGDYAETAYAPTGRTENVQRIRRGRWEDMGKQSMYVPGPGSPNAPQHALILQALLRSVCTRWNAPEFLGSADASNANYASTLVAGSPFVVRITREQAKLRAAFVRLIQGAVEHYLDTHGGVKAKTGTGSEVKYNRDAIENLTEIVCDCPEPIMRNELEMAQVRQIERQNGILSPQTWATMAGYDADEETAKIREYNDQNPVESPLDLQGMFQRPSPNGVA